MKNMINIKSNWKHASLEYQIKKLDTSQDVSRSAILIREIKAAENVTDWKEIKGLLLKVERLDVAPTFSNLQAKYDDESAETLERVKRQILVDLSEDLKVLQTQYLVQLLMANYLEELKKEALAIRAGQQVESEDIDVPEMGRLFVEMILLDKDSDALREIKNILVEWRNNR